MIAEVSDIVFVIKFANLKNIFGIICVKLQRDRFYHCSVKPAVFDLFLGIAIAAYLAMIYLIVQVYQLFSASIIRSVFA